jgi:hypothetical protein
MKRSSAVLLIAAIFLASTQLQAQARIGVFGGISTGKLLTEAPDGDSTTDDDDPLLGIVLGLTMHRQLSNGFVFAPEAMYVTKGYADENSDGKLSMSYLEVPLLFRKSFAGSGTVTPFITAGPQVSLQLSCKLFDEDGDDDISCDDFYGDDESFSKFDAGLVFGGGITTGNLSFGIRYDLGLMNIDEASGWTSKNRSLQLLVGYFFR